MEHSDQQLGYLMPNSGNITIIRLASSYIFGMAVDISLCQPTRGSYYRRNTYLIFNNSSVLSIAASMFLEQNSFITIQYALFEPFSRL